MAIISYKHRYLFIQAGRTACSAIAQGVLIPHLDGHRFPPGGVVGDDGRVVVHPKHASLPELLRHGVLRPDEAESLLTFATVRNPFDREVSLYVKHRGDAYGERPGGLNLERLKQHEHGIDFGPSSSPIDAVLRTASGDIELALVRVHDRH